MKTIYTLRYPTSPGVSASATANTKMELAHLIAYLCEGRADNTITVSVTQKRVSRKRK